MIKFSLKCAAGHRFESWFSDNASFEALQSQGLVECPVCGETRVEKALMAPRVRTTKAKDQKGPLPGQAQGPHTAPQMPAASPPPAATQMPVANQVPVAQAYQAWARAVQAHVTSTFESVGDRFAEEARKIHYGETENRPIYGQASGQEIKELAEEGIETAPLPDPEAAKKAN